MGVRFLHTSDWQLGMTRHFLEGEAQGRFSQARLDAIETMGQQACDHGASFIVVAGDAFDSNQPDATTVARALQTLSRVPVPVLLLPGNHDCLDAGSVYRSRAFRERCPDHVRVLDDDAPRRPVEGVEVVGAPWRSKHPLTDLAGECCGSRPADGQRRVVVGHGAVDAVSGDFDAPGQIRLAALERAVADGRVSYVALGDRHSCTDVGETGRVRYSGAPEPTDYTELDAGAALLVDLADDGGCEVERLPVGTWRFERLDLPVDSDEDLDALERRLSSLPDPARTIVKCSLTGTLTLRQAERLERLLEHHRHVLAALEHPERHRDVAVLPADGDLADLPLRGYAATARDRLLQRSQGRGEDARAASDALGLLLRLVDDDARAEVSA